MVKWNSTRRFDRSSTVWHPLLTHCQRIQFLYSNLNHRMNNEKFAVTIQIVIFSHNPYNITTEQILLLGQTTGNCHEIGKTELIVALL